MQRVRSSVAAAAVMAAGLMGAGNPASAVVNIPASAKAGPTQVTPGTGLNGSVYNLGTATVNGGTPATLSAQVMSSTLSATYNALRIQYTGGDTTPTNTYLGVDATGTAATDIAPLQSTILDMKGYINIPAATTYTFSTTTDDGSYVLIGGLTVVNNPTGGSPPGTTPVSGDANFAAAGLYPFEILYFNQDQTNDFGSAAVNYNSTVPGDATGSAHTALYPLSVLLPEPASFGVLAMAGSLLIGRRRRR